MPHDQNGTPNLTAREQAAVEQMARKAVASGGSDATASSAAANAKSDDLNQKELVHNLQQADLNRASVLNGLTPSVEDPNQVQMETYSDPDQLDVDMFARGDITKVVDSLKAQKALEQRQALAAKANLPFVRLLGYPISPEVLPLVPFEISQRTGVIAYLRAGNKVRLGVTNPLAKDTVKAVDALKRNTDFDYLVSVIGDDSYQYAMDLYEEIPRDRRNANSVDVASGDKEAFENDIRSLMDLKTRVKDVPTTKVIDTLLTGAVRVGASDIHIEPQESGVRIRYRMDGVLQTIADFPASVTNPILSRLKFLAKLKLDVNHNPQDGRFSVSEMKGAETHEIDVRVATIPSEFGESITMRLLDRNSLNVKTESLGLTGLALERVREALKKPQGLILECGPTGSGKTTTLYAFLSQLNSDAKKIITLEDPVEYRLDGITQSQVNPAGGYDFADGFRSVLRLDPDIIMIGEMRDTTSAELATQAALTGHIVFSTLHTNDAPTVIPRLIDLGVRPFLLSNAVNVIIAQRLVRQVCQFCAHEYRPPEEALKEVRAILKRVPKAAKAEVPPEDQWLFMEGAGCERCNNTGYRGRLGIYEVLVPDHTIEKLAIDHAPVSEIKDAAVAAGMITMEQDGLIKAVTGATTVNEVWRVARDI